MARRANFLQALSGSKVSVVKLDGENIRSDILTKVVSSATFAKLRHFILNIRHRVDAGVLRCMSSVRVRYCSQD